LNFNLTIIDERVGHSVACQGEKQKIAERR
jgi:hypothetical protein